ncbi:MAG: creatininase family protein, partial [Pseudomonadota bacterium]
MTVVPLHPKPPPSRWWRELTTEDFTSLDPDRVVAILPVAAIEQHGPHLPLCTDSCINDGMIAHALDRAPDQLQVLVLPTQQVGKSDEHLSFPGTLSVDAETLIRAWRQIGEGVAGAGLRKLVIVNSHGGQPQVVEIVTRDLRALHGMLAVATSWNALGQPDGVVSETDLRFGFHAGDVETSLMLHFRPELVRMDKAEDFKTLTEEMSRSYAILAPEGRHGFAWMAEDLNPQGAAGEAHKATAEKGRALADY